MTEKNIDDLTKRIKYAVALCEKNGNVDRVLGISMVAAGISKTCFEENPKFDPSKFRENCG